MNPLGIIGVIVLAVMLDIPWALYYLAIQIIFSFVVCDVIVAIIWMIAPIYFGLPWWYDLLLFQHLFFVCGTASLAEKVRKGEMNFEEAQSLRVAGYNVSTALLFISVVGSFYWFFSK